MLRVLKPLVYEQAEDFVRLCFEVVLVLLLGTWIAVEGKALYRAHRREGGRSLGAYFGDGWRALDWCNALLFVIALVRVRGRGRARARVRVRVRVRA